MSSGTDAPASNVYTEAQHLSLLTSAVERETAGLQTEKSELETQVATLASEKAASDAALADAQSRIDVLEAEKASLATERDVARQEFDDFKAELARAKEIDELKAERVTAVKAVNANLSEDFFTEERVTRWAQMATEEFTSLVADMTDAASAITTKAAATDTDAGEGKRETAAFSGGEATKTTEAGSTATQLMAARRRLQSA